MEPPLDPGLYRETVRRALAEDLGWGDATTLTVVPADARAAGGVGVAVARAPDGGGLPAARSRGDGQGDACGGQHGFGGIHHRFGPGGGHLL